MTDQYMQVGVDSAACPHQAWLTVGHQAVGAQDIYPSQLAPNSNGGMAVILPFWPDIHREQMCFLFTSEFWQWVFDISFSFKM